MPNPLPSHPRRGRRGPAGRPPWRSAGLALLCTAGLAGAVVWATPGPAVTGTPVAAERVPDHPAHSLAAPGALDRRWGLPGGAPPPQPSAIPSPEQAQVSRPTAQRPGTVRLPHGGTARLVRKEVRHDGVLPIPDGVRDATWWGAGLNTSGGATVLAGHVNWRGVEGPFAELWWVKRGQVVTVVDAAGASWRYQISEIVTVDKHDLPTRATELFGQDGAHRLVLVTCGGRWVGGELGYDENRIVVATPL
ncbi:class F sortase [Longimycelium tulufanense]|uniref:class F sortase n=1 Tax=Longimycelium tulufanense TaxID=907463 RepID=UPI00166949C3|nr:class F sortase [Longimycelium tulufanense]